MEELWIVESGLQFDSIHHETMYDWDIFNQLLHWVPENVDMGSGRR